MSRETKYRADGRNNGNAVGLVPGRFMPPGNPYFLASTLQGTLV